MIVKELILFGLIGLFMICSFMEINKLTDLLNEANEKIDSIQRRLF